MKMICRIAIVLLALCGAASAQQVPNHAVPIGRGLGVGGFKAVGPCATNTVILGQGAAADPICATIPAGSLASQAADTVLMNASGLSAAPSAVALVSCATGGALTYNTTTHAWTCAATLDAVAIGGTTPGAGTFTAGTFTQQTILSGRADATISGDQNDWNPTGLSTASSLFVDGGVADRNITGLQGGVTGRILIIVNKGTTNAIVLKNNSGSSSAANRFLMQGDTTLPPNTALEMRYDGIVSEWRPASRSLSNTGVTAGSYGSATQVPAITVDVSGRVTAAANTTIALPASAITSGQLAVAQGGTGADLSATGGTSQVLKQISAGAAVTVARLACSDISDCTSGTWTPVVSTTATVGTPAYSIQFGSWRKRGDLYEAQGQVSLSGWTGSPTGFVVITGLPATSGNTTGDLGGCSVGAYSVGSTGPPRGVIFPNNSRIDVYNTSTTSNSAMTAAAAGTTFQMSFACLFHT